MFDRSHDAAAARRRVSETYASVGAPKAGARLAGYADEQLDALPAGAAEELYGCGNPLAYADVKRGQTVLDLGSGAGVDLILAAQAVGEDGRVIGVEMTPSMIARARRNVAAAGLTNAEVREGIIEELPVDDASVDWVVSNCVVSLSPEKDRVFREIARVLKPGGRALISDIVVDDALACVLSVVEPYLPSIGGARTEGHYLKAMLDAGLTDVEVRGRFVYEPDHLVGLFGDGLTTDAEGCPVRSLGARAAGSALGRRCLSSTAERVSGRVVSSKFFARKPLAA